jgi:hypothetical protein
VTELSDLLVLLIGDRGAVERLRELVEDEHKLVELPDDTVQ